MKKIYLLLVLLISAVLPVNAQAPGDTITIPTFNYTQTYGINQWSPGIRDTVIDFSVLPNVTYEKVLMTYNMRCKDGLVSPPVSGQTDIGCGEWDISCNTYLHDSSAIDSVGYTHPDYVISGFAGGTFNYATQPTHDYFQYTLQQVVVNSTISDTVAVLGNGSSSLDQVMPVQFASGKSQYLLTAAELSSAGLFGGDLDGLRLEVQSGSSTANFLRIRMKHTTANALDPDNVDLTGFSQVYFNHFTAATGTQQFQFASPFTWDGVSNVLLELNFTNSTSQSVINFAAENAPLNTAMSNQTTDNFMEFSGGQSHIDLDTMNINYANGMTYSAWIYYDNFSHWSRLIDFGNGPGSDNIIIANQGTTNNLCLHVYSGGSSSNVYANGSLTLNEWHHIAATVNSGGAAVLYLDGQQVATGTVNLPNSLARNRCYIGRSNWSNDAYFDGKMDDVAMWNTVLTQTEIQDWMYKDIDNTHPKYADLLFAYNFNDGNATQATDISGAGWNGSLEFGALTQLFHGRDIFKNEEIQTLRPNMTLLQGNYNLTITPVTVLDSLELVPNVITQYQVVPHPNTLMDDEIQAIGTSSYWEAAPQNVYDGELGTFLSTLPAPPVAGSITPMDLDYFRRWPAKFEIMSFVTPYGINLDLGPEGKTWTFDMTDYLPILNGQKRMTIERGGQWMEDMDIQFHFIVGTPPRDVLDIKQLWRPESRNYTSINNNTFFPPRDLLMLPNGNAFEIRSMITGHGQEGEFIPRNHYLNVDGGPNEFTWQLLTECGDNPIYPQGGTWVYDRTGWCPGAPTDLRRSDITPFVTAGQTANIDYDVQVASGDSRYIVTHQLVSYGAPNHTLDAAIVEVREPSDRVEFQRFNSICHDPKLVIQNTGSTALTSLTIEYWINSGTPETYTWSGNLAFLETEVVTLPAPSTIWNAITPANNVFHARIMAPNGGTDEYQYNDTYDSPFTFAETLPANIVLGFRTNNAAYENTYEVLDDQGNQILYRSFLSPNTVYKDTLMLAPGCYTYNVYDSGDDGIAWWANNDGTGDTYMDILGGGTIKSFEPDFGDNIHFNFTVDFPLSYEESLTGGTMTLYPNPAGDRINVEYQGIHADQILQVYDMQGRLVLERKESTVNNLLKSTIDLSNFRSGAYMVRIIDGNQTRSDQFLKQ